MQTICIIKKRRIIYLKLQFKFKNFISVLCTSMLLTGCGSSPMEKKDDKLQVYTSFYPMYDFTKKIGGDHVDVKNMTPAGTEPHDFEPSTTDIKNINEADMFIYNGDDMEHWVRDVKDSLDNDKLKIVKASKNITLMSGSEEGDSDPHTWLSLKNAKTEMKTIKDELVELDPDHEKDYTANYDKYAKELDQLDSDFTKQLQPYEGRAIVVAHQAFGYLCQDYGLEQIPIEGLSPDSEPTPAKMKEIIDDVKKNNINVIFYEELVDPKVAETIAKETGSETKVLNTLEGLSDEELKDGKDYISVMKDNLNALLYAFKK